MKKLTDFRQIGDLHFNQHCSNREIASVLSIGAATVSRALSTIRRSGIPWSELEKLSPTELLAILCPDSVTSYLEPDFELYDKKRRKSNKLTLQYFYNEFYLSADNPKQLPRFSYTRFCALFNAWSHDHHGQALINVPPFLPGEVAEIDFSGDPILYRNHFGVINKAWVFVFCLRFSKLIHVELVPDQSASSWLLGCSRALRAIGGAPKMLSIDNARALVSQPDLYVGSLTAALRAFCRHYHIEVLTNKIRAPKHKQATEYACGQFQEKIQAPLTKDGSVFANSLEELNAKIKADVDKFNNRPFTERALGSRSSLFEREERATLLPLPEDDFKNYKWSILTVDQYHWVKKDGRRYMVAVFHGRQASDLCQLTD